MGIPLTSNQRYLIRCALGLGIGSEKEAKRNCHASTQRLSEWEDLVEKGGAKSTLRRSLYGDYRIVYSATKAGALAVLNPGEEINPIIMEEMSW